MRWMKRVWRLLLLSRNERAALGWANALRVRRGLAPLAAMPCGSPCDAYACPMSRALSLGQSPVAHDWGAGPNDVSQWRNNLGRSVQHIYPPAVAQFVRDFDAGCYPHLERGRR